MTRTLLLLAALAMASQASAWTYTLSPTDPFGIPVGATFDYWVDLPYGNVWNLPDLVAADFDDDEFVLDATTAIAYGFDWDAFETTMAGGVTRTGVFYRANPEGWNLSPRFAGYINTSPGITVHEVRLTALRTRVGDASHGDTFAHTLTIDATGAPEPASGLLLLIGLCGLACHRSHTPNRATKYFQRR